MKYWDEYQDKFGFNDGESTPPDAYACRYVYVREINHLAEKNESKHRLIAFDRNGMHNSFLILCVPKEIVDGHSEMDICGGFDLDKYTEDVAPDLPMSIAIEEAHSMELDQYVVSTVQILDSSWKATDRYVHPKGDGK